MATSSDIWILDQATAHGMIEPFIEAQRRKGCISYGLSSYGYDARVADEFKIFTNVDPAAVDPREFAANSFAAGRRQRGDGFNLRERELRPFAVRRAAAIYTRSNGL